MKVIKQMMLLAAFSVVASSCSLFGKKGGAATAENPGQLSTATGLRYNDEETGSFKVTEFDRSEAHTSEVQSH